MNERLHLPVLATLSSIGVVSLVSYYSGKADREKLYTKYCSYHGMVYNKYLKACVNDDKIEKIKWNK